MTDSIISTPTTATTTTGAAAAARNRLQRSVADKRFMDCRQQHKIRSASVTTMSSPSGSTLVANPIDHHWPLSDNRRKRDFHIQVIQVHEGPKWYVWPGRTDDQANTISPAKNNSNQENDAICSTTAAGTPANDTGMLTRERGRHSRRHLHHLHQFSTVDSGDVMMSAGSENCLHSKPIPTPHHDSQTFKILSVDAKHTDTDDEDYEHHPLCGQKSYSLDNEPHFGSPVSLFSPTFVNNNAF